MTLDSVLTFLNSPLAAAALVVLAMLFPGAGKVLGVVKRIAAALAAVKVPPPADPVDGAKPGGAPLIDAVRALIEKLARERFPWLTKDAAVIRFAAELAEEEAKRTEAERLAPITRAEAPTTDAAARGKIGFRTQ